MKYRETCVLPSSQVQLQSLVQLPICQYGMGNSSQVNKSSQVMGLRTRTATIFDMILSEAINVFKV